MPNIKLNYLYRDGANYKNHSEAIFSNPENLSFEEIEKAIKEKLIDDTWFYASKWKLRDLHFDKWDDEIDHTFHEFESVENTEEPPTEAVSVHQFLQLVAQTKF